MNANEVYEYEMNQAEIECYRYKADILSKAYFTMCEPDSKEAKRISDLLDISSKEMIDRIDKALDVYKVERHND